MIGNQRLGWQQAIEREVRTLVVAHLAFTEQHDDRAFLPVTDDVELKFSPPLVCPIRRGTTPLHAASLSGDALSGRWRRS